METCLRKLIDALREGREMEEVLGELGITAEEAARLMESAASREVIEAARSVGAVQTELQSRKHAAAAVRKLRELMSAEKGEVQLKAAMALLGMTQEKEPLRRRERPAKKPRMNEAEVKEWMMAISKVLLKRRRKLAMGPPPRKRGK